MFVSLILSKLSFRRNLFVEILEEWKLWTLYSKRCQFINHDGIFSYKDAIFGYQDGILSYQDAIFGYQDGIFSNQDGIFGYQDDIFVYQDGIFVYQDDIISYKYIRFSNQDIIFSYKYAIFIDKNATFINLDVSGKFLTASLLFRYNASCRKWLPTYYRSSGKSLWFACWFIIFWNCF